MKKILIVEDQMLARKYLCSCIEKSTECEVASALTRADAALQRCGEGHIDLVVMVTSMLEGRFLDRARKIGADSFWYKDSPSGDLISVIEGTLAGKNFWPDKVPAVQLGKALSCDLSDQEMETLRLLCEGKTNAEIAAKLHVAESSVRTYINRMLEKTGYTNRNRLMVAAVSKRLVVPSSQLDV